jgi:predicted ATPase
LSEVAASPKNVTAKTVDYWLSQLTFFHFHDTSMTSALRTHARAADDRDLRSDGSNLAAYLGRLEHSDEGKAWRRINHFVGRIAPSVKALSPTPTANNGNAVRLDWIDDQDERFGAHQLSDGTLRAIALITALAQPTQTLRKFISIDEPELGLHPAAIHLLAELARSVSRHTQILLATQSTALLDNFSPEEIVVVERNAGASSFHRLDPAALEGWLDDYSLSEVFEKGVIGGRP